MQLREGVCGAHCVFCSRAYRKKNTLLFHRYISRTECGAPRTVLSHICNRVFRCVRVASRRCPIQDPNQSYSSLPIECPAGFRRNMCWVAAGLNLLRWLFRPYINVLEEGPMYSSSSAGLDAVFLKQYKERGGHRISHASERARRPGVNVLNCLLSVPIAHQNHRHYTHTHIRYDRLLEC